MNSDGTTQTEYDFFSIRVQRSFPAVLFREDPMFYREIAASLFRQGLTRRLLTGERIRQIEQEAFRKLQRHPGVRELAQTFLRRRYRAHANEQGKDKPMGAGAPGEHEAHSAAELSEAPGGQIAEVRGTQGATLSGADMSTLFRPGPTRRLYAMRRLLQRSRKIHRQEEAGRL